MADGIARCDRESVAGGGKHGSSLGDFSYVRKGEKLKGLDTTFK
jgi:hypothetical protein